MEDKAGEHFRDLVIGRISSPRQRSHLVEEVDDLALTHCLWGPEGTSHAWQGHKGAELSASLGTGQAVGAPRKDVCLRETLCGLSWPGTGSRKGSRGAGAVEEPTECSPGVGGCVRGGSRVLGGRGAEAQGKMPRRPRGHCLEPLLRLAVLLVKHRWATGQSLSGRVSCLGLSWKPELRSKIRR